MFYCQYCHYWKETKQLSQVVCSILAQARSSAVTWQYISHFSDALFQCPLCFPKWGAHDNKMASVYFTRANWSLAGSVTFPKTESFSHTGNKCGGFRQVQAPAGGKQEGFRCSVTFNNYDVSYLVRERTWKHKPWLFLDCLQQSVHWIPKKINMIINNSIFYNLNEDLFVRQWCSNLLKCEM